MRPTRLGIASGEEWLSVRGFRHTERNEFPVCWTDVYINREFAADGRRLQRHTGPIFHLIEDLFGQSIVEVHQEIAAALISPALADGLKVKAGTTALEVQRTYKLATGKIAQIAIPPNLVARKSAGCSQSSFCELSPRKIRLRRFRGLPNKTTSPP